MSVPRYSKQPFPPYRFVPGESPHPRRDPKGHSYGKPEPVGAPFPPEDWKTSEMYLYGIDLYNYGYWWECHEQLEALWHAIGHETDQGQFLQGLIQVAAANLKKFQGNDVAVDLATRGLARHKNLSGIYMGVKVQDFHTDVTVYFESAGSHPALISLRG